MGQSSFEGPGELAAAMDDFDASLIINPLTYDESKNRRLLEESLESIISGAALLADSRYIKSLLDNAPNYLRSWVHYPKENKNIFH